MSTKHVTRDDALRRFRWVGLWLPIALVAVSTAAQVALLPQLPDRVASHWNAAGVADGFAPAWSFPLVMFAVGVGTIALIAGTALVGTSRTSGPVDLRFMTAITLGTAGFLGLLSLGLLAGQVGLDDPATASTGWQLPVAGLVLGVLLGVVGWKATLRSEENGPDGSTPEALILGRQEKAVWLRTATMSRGAMTGLGVALAAGVTGAVVTALAGEPGAWVAVVSLALVLVVGVVLTVFRVRVDGTGLTVTSAVGWPTVHIARSDIRLVQVVQVNPMAEYGGWGWRHSPSGGHGIVMRSGEALRITRTDGRLFTVTVDDATTAAALLRTYQEREAL